MCFRPGLKFLISQSEGQTSRIYSGRPISKSQTSAARPSASKLVGSAQCASSKIISIGFCRQTSRWLGLLFSRAPRFSEKAGLADVKSQAQEDKLKCELVRLPKLEKRLQE